MNVCAAKYLHKFLMPFLNTFPEVKLLAASWFPYVRKMKPRDGTKELEARGKVVGSESGQPTSQNPDLLVPDTALFALSEIKKELSRFPRWWKTPAVRMGRQQLRYDYLQKQRGSEFKVTHGSYWASRTSDLDALEICATPLDLWASPALSLFWRSVSLPSFSPASRSWMGLCFFKFWGISWPIITQRLLLS